VTTPTNGWTRVRFAEMAESVTERVDDPSASGVDRYVGLEHLDPGSLRISRWGVPTDVEATKLRFAAGDVVFGRRRAYQRKIALADFDGICSAHALVLRAKPNVALPEFLPLLMQSDLFFNRALAISVGSLSPTINWKDLAKQEFDLPPLADQKRIAELLWAVEQQIEAMTHLVSAVHELAASISSATFRQRNIEWKAVESVVKIARAGGTPLRSEARFFGGTIPWVKSGELPSDGITTAEEHLTNDGLDSSSAWLVPPGSTLVAMYGEGTTRGEVGYTNAPVSTNQAILALVPDPALADGRFLYHWMRSRKDALRARSAGSSQKNLTKQLIGAEPFPSIDIAEQHRLAEQLDLAARAKATLETNLTRSRVLLRELGAHLLTQRGEL